MDRRTGYEELLSSCEKDLKQEIASEGVEGLVSTPTTTKLVSHRYTSDPITPRIQVLFNEKMCHGVEAYQKQRAMAKKLLLSSKDSMNFNLYITEVTEFDTPEYQNKFCKLLRTLGSSQTLHIYTGNYAYGVWPVYTLGSMLDAMQRTQARIITHVNGRASFAETCLWLWGHERYLSEFGTLQFIGFQKYLEQMPMYHTYFKTLLDRAVLYKVLSSKEETDCMTTNKCIQLTYSDVIARINAKDAEAEVEEPLDAPI